ncbi:unnamed protein product [Phaedon cochleariae]|uniref:Transferrin-like domain-containing protein n=1 Tax=Phaedon cochleariae TaxID=80249 RepID=A0A9P0GJR9_PHACE|nr:unnamed protein product [Phaedon cochleariae]
MSFKFSELIVLVVLFFSGVSPQELKNKICIENYNVDACNNIKRNQIYGCTEHIVSKTDCFLNIDRGLSQIALVYPEQALLAAPLVSDRVVVIGTVKAKNPPYQTVVIVRKPFRGGFENLRGKRFCHPGYKHDELVTKYVLEEFESKILSVNGNFCDAAGNITLVEKRIRSLANFLGNSCKPGIWTEDEVLDRKLKSKYSSLCELCGSRKCDTEYQVPFKDTLNCLQDKPGEIALTTLKDARIFFNNSNNIRDFQYLCRNGTVSDGDAQNPCTWTQQLDRVIITGKEYEGTARSFLTNHLASQSVGDLQLQSIELGDSLRKVLEIERSDEIILHGTTSSLKTYVESRRSIPDVTDNIQCNTTVKWCTMNENEQQKCRWLRQATLNAGLQPVIECVQTSENNTISCLSTIQSEEADIVFTDVNYGYIALQKGLSVVAYPETDNRQLSAIVIVLRNDTTDVKSFKDLRGKSACLPEYGGKEWLVFIDFMRSKGIMPRGFNYEKLFSDFVGDSCVPGAISEDYKIEENIRNKLCAHCIPESNRLTAKYCNADQDNKYYTSDGALRCLLETNATYAIITVNDVTEFYDTSMFRVLSKNGTLSKLPGIYNLDEEAPLNIITAGEVVAKNDTRKKADIVLLLRDIEVKFGESLRKTFKVFEEFNKTKDLIFPDSTPGLTFDGSEIKYVENFKNLLRNSERHLIDPNSHASYPVIPSTILMLIGFFILRF